MHSPKACLIENCLFNNFETDAECLDFEEFVGQSDAVYKSTRGATTAQKLKRKALCIGLKIIITMTDNQSFKKSTKSTKFLIIK